EKNKLRSPLLPQTDLNLAWAEPPPIDGSNLTWDALSSLETLLPQLTDTSLLYGYQRPYVSVQDLSGQLIYDRPRSPCKTVVLWTLPPSWTHLRWLLAVARPHRVYVRNGVPKMPDAAVLRSQLGFQIVKQPEAKLNLLDLGQQWWVSPSVLIAMLREMGYPCPNFPKTDQVEQELERLVRWYQCPAQRLAQLT
ncbi:MAG: single-stranded-DNA-specific exonuclease RecJ, partial [Thermosynechococcaceae cyanobacterium]